MSTEIIKRKKKLSNTKKKALIGLAFTSPWIIGFLAFGLYPLLRSIRFSLATSGKTDYETMKFTLTGFGFTQFKKIFTEQPEHLLAIGDFALDLAVVIPVVLVFSLILALLLNQKLKGKGVFRSIFFLPVVLLSGNMLRYFNSYNLLTVPSITNGALERVISTYFPEFISTIVITAFSKIVLILWLSGVQTLIFLAGLQKIDKTVYEAAKVDGASPWECFWKITFMELIPLMYINIVYTTIIYSNLGEYNPIINIISNVQSDEVNYGKAYSSAMAWILFLIDILEIGIYCLAIKLGSKRYE